MEARPIPARAFMHSIIGLRRADRFIYKGVNFKPVESTAEGYVVQAEGDKENKVFLSHQAIYDALDSRQATIDYNFDAPARAKMRAVFGDKTWDDFSEDARRLALHKEKLILLYDEEVMRRGKRIPMSEDKMGALLRTWTEMCNGELFKTLNENRADQVTQVSLYPCPSARTFKRDYDDYEGADRDVMALLPRHHGPGKKMSSISPQALTFAFEQAMGYMDRRRPTMALVYRNYLAALQAHNKTAITPLKISKVSRKKFESIIGKFDRYHVHASRFGEKQALDKFKNIRKSFYIRAPGQRLEMDFVTVDLMSHLVESGVWASLPDYIQTKIPAVRITFCAAIDVATRYILGFKASTNPNAASAVACIRMIMSDKRHLSTYVSAQTPWIGKLRPLAIYTDNGPEFANEHVNGVLRAARVDGTKPPAGEPDARPFIESLFNSIGHLVAPYFEGRTFSSVSEKGDYDPKLHASLLVDELIQIYIFAICDIYHNKPHSGLGGNTPHNEWVQASRDFPILYPPGPEEMLHIFGVKSKRPMSDYGITVFGITYCNEELQRLRTKPSFAEVEIKYDPECVAHISVKGDKGWFVVRNTIDLDENITIAEWMAARKELKDHYETANQQGLNVMYDAINRLRSIGEAATLRAGLTPSAPTAKEYDRWDAELYGAWAATASENKPALNTSGILPENPLRDGNVADLTMLFTQNRKAAIAAEKAAAAPSDDEETSATTTEAATSAFDFDQEY